MNSADHSVTRTARTLSGSPQASTMRPRRDEVGVSGGSVAASFVRGASTSSETTSGEAAASEDVVALSPAATSSTGRLSRVVAARIRLSGLLHLQLDVDARREVEPLKRLDGLAGRLDDVDQALVDAHLEMLATVLVDVR